MFPGRFFPERFFAARYWPKVGAAGTTVELVYSCLLYSLPPSLGWCELVGLAWYSSPPSLAWWEE